MLVERRRSLRRQVNWPGKIDGGPGSELRDCVIVNISDTGALIAVKTAKAIPDNFTVIMSPSGSPTRRCRLMWRAGDRLGVEFDDHWHRHHQPGLTDEIEPAGSSD